MVIEVKPQVEQGTGYSIDIPPMLPAHVQILIDARTLIGNPKHWNQGSYHNHGTYCAVGAVGHFARRRKNYRKNHKLAVQLLAKTIKSRVTGNSYIQRDVEIVTSFNDFREHEEVMVVFDEAIELGLKEQG